MRTNDDRACPQWSQTFNCRLRKDRHISWKNEDVYTRVGERKETVEYWLFTCKQNTNVFSHGDLGGGVVACHSEFFSFRAMEKEIQFLWELQKSPGSRVGVSAQHRRGEISFVKGKANLHLEVLRWEAVC